MSTIIISGGQRNLNLGALPRSIPTPLETIKYRSESRTVNPSAQERGICESVIKGPIKGS